MIRVRVSPEIFIAWMTIGNTMLPARCTNGLPQGCELFRAGVGVNGDLEAYLLSPHEVTKIRGGETLDFQAAMDSAEDLAVVYQKCKVEIQL